MIDIKKECPELDLLLKEELIEPFDVEFARTISTLEGSIQKTLAISSSLVSRFRRDGHVCVDLKKIKKGNLFDLDMPHIQEMLPDENEWKNNLLSTKTVVRPGDRGPLVLDEKLRLYLYRFWKYEQLVFNAIKYRTMEDMELPDLSIIKNLLNRHYPFSDKNDWQKIASAIALKKRFCAISGGPGTGKTHLIFKIISLIKEISSYDSASIVLLAPTGKASARMKEAFQKVKNSSDESASSMPYTSTIHRFLIGLRTKKKPKNLPKTPQLVIVDEASMVDLELMAKLFQTLKENCQIILTGDKNQLSSVEAGAVFSDICPQERKNIFSSTMCRYLKEVTGDELIPGQVENNEIGDCIVNLERSYRFGPDSGIYQLSRAIKECDWESAISILKNKDYPDVTWKSIDSVKTLKIHLKRIIEEHFKKMLDTFSPSEALRLMDEFRILTPIREGPSGVLEINRLAENILTRGSMSLNMGEWYHGKPIIITRNNYELELFNGDVGIVLKEASTLKDLRVYFSSEDNSIRSFHPMLIPEYETAYAMTVHKSQGSEFNKVLLILPPYDLPLLTRELLYTAVTRAKHRVEIWGNEDILKASILRRTIRISGLKDLLWK